MQIQKRIRDNILFELGKPHYHINQKINRLSSVALSIQNKIRQYGNQGEFCDVMTIHTGNECFGM